MIRIRLRRTGLKKQPSYRVVVADQRTSRDGRFIEIIGHYNPRTRPATEVLQEDRALHWLSVGAQPSDSVKRIMQHTGTWERFERLRKGEDLEKLVEEAQKAATDVQDIDPRTAYPAPAAGASKQKEQEMEAIVDEVETESNAVPADDADAEEDASEDAEA